MEGGFKAKMVSLYRFLGPDLEGLYLFGAHQNRVVSHFIQPQGPII